MSDRATNAEFSPDAERIEGNVARVVELCHGWALHMAGRFNGAVYLVGSVLHNPSPRDIDIRIVVEDHEFAARYRMTLHHVEFDQYHPMAKRGLVSGKIVKWDDDPPSQTWVDDCAKLGGAMSKKLSRNVDLKVWPESYWREPYPTPITLAAPSRRWFIYNKHVPDPSAPAPKSVVREPDDRPGRASMAEQVEFLAGHQRTVTIGHPIHAPCVVVDHSGNQPGQGNTGPGSTVYNPQYQEYLDAHPPGCPTLPLCYEAWLACDQPKEPVVRFDGEDGG